MAIDTANKRGSVIAGMLPLASGSIDQGDRQQVVFIYRGLLVGPPTEEIIIDFLGAKMSNITVGKFLKATSASNFLKVIR